MENEDQFLKDLYRQHFVKPQPNTPEFDALWNAAKQQKRNKHKRWLMYSIAASLVFVSALTFIMQFNSADSVQTELLAEWSAPTESLLEYNNWYGADTMNAALGDWASPTDYLFEFNEQ